MMSMPASADEEVPATMEAHEARLVAWLAEGRELLASLRSGTQEKVTHFEQRIEVLEEQVAADAEALARANQAAENASAEKTRLEARAARLYDHLVDRSRRDLAFLQCLEGSDASPGEMAADNLAAVPAAEAPTLEAPPSADNAGEMVLPEEIASDAIEAANILCARGAADGSISAAGSDAEGATAIVLSVPRPLLEASERLVGDGLAGCQEDVLRRWLLDGWRLGEDGDGGSTAEPGTVLRQPSRTRAARPPR